MPCAPHLPRISLAAAACLLLAAAAGCRSPGAHRPTPSELDGLLEEYRALGLPEPEGSESLVRIDWDSHGALGVVYALGFAHAQPPATSPTAVLLGTRRVGCGTAPIRLVRPGSEALDLDRYFGGRFDSVPGDARQRSSEVFALALQCHGRGYSDLAVALAARPIFLTQLDREPPADLEERLHDLAWLYLVDALAEPRSDRAAIHAHLEALLGCASELPEREPGCERLVEGLGLALVPSSAAPGSPEALVDGLVEACGVECPERSDGPLMPRWGRDGEGRFVAAPPLDPRIAALARLGLAAVPALVAHLGDIRLTRQVFSTTDGVIFNAVERRHLRTVGEVAHDVLAAYAEGWLARNGYGRFDRERIDEWWAEARRSPEERVLLASLVPDGLSAPHPVVLEALAARHPRALGEAYLRAVRARPAESTWRASEGRIAEALGVPGDGPGTLRERIAEALARTPP